MGAPQTTPLAAILIGGSVLAFGVALAILPRPDAGLLAVVLLVLGAEFVN